MPNVAFQQAPERATGALGDILLVASTIRLEMGTRATAAQKNTSAGDTSPIPAECILVTGMNAYSQWMENLIATRSLSRERGL